MTVKRYGHNKRGGLVTVKRYGHNKRGGLVTVMATIREVAW